jgi:glutamine---fructose-6-phosphate transaminase (isomerizing)
MTNSISSIDAMEKEVRYQVDYLHDLNLPEKVSFENCILVGSGDSYAAALTTSYASNRKLICCDPMEISFNPEIVKNRSIYLLSVSGNTKSNIHAAKVSRKLGSLTTAITSKPQSILARNCDRVIELRYKTAGISTSGTISFTASLLSCLSLIGKASIPYNLRQIYRQAYRQARNLSISTSSQKKVSTIILLGEGILFALALYGTLKINEVLGLRSFAYSVEEFCHSPLFGLKKSDQVIIFGHTPKNIGVNGNKTTTTAAAAATTAGKLNVQLQGLGYSSEYVDCASNSRSLTELLLRSTILLQLFVIKQARLKGLKQCIFLRKKNLLALSSGFIYQ